MLLPSAGVVTQAKGLDFVVDTKVQSSGWGIAERAAVHIEWMV
jgi:hypothetical protein